jgi:pSer/pThr/pTyr-binding forkhead associated (FHA) protein
MSVGPEKTVAYRSVMEQELAGVEQQEFDVRPSFVESMREPCFWILSKGLLRQRTALSTQAILRIGTERDVCDVALTDTTCSPVHVVIIRLENGWLLCDTGREGPVRFDGVESKQNVIGFDQNCMIEMGGTTILFNTADRKGGTRKFNAVGLKYPLMPFADMPGTAGECHLRNDSVAISLDPKGPSLNLDPNAGRTKGRALLLGKHKLSDVPMLGEWVSPAQAFVYWGDDGMYVRDLGSQNDTMLDGQSIKADRPFRFEDRAVIKVGDNMIQARMSGDVPTRAAELTAKKTGTAGFMLSPLVGTEGEPLYIPPESEPRMAGRDSGADLVLPDTFVSRAHFMVMPFEKRIMVKDNNSSNGTYINGRAIDEAECMPGDILSAGRCTFLIHYAM